MSYFYPFFFFLTFLVSSILTGRKEVDNGTTPTVTQRPLRSEGILDDNISAAQQPPLTNENRIWPTLATMAESRSTKHASLSLRNECRHRNESQPPSQRRIRFGTVSCS